MDTGSNVGKNQPRQVSALPCWWNLTKSKYQGPRLSDVNYPDNMALRMCTVLATQQRWFKRFVFVSLNLFHLITLHFWTGWLLKNWLVGNWSYWLYLVAWMCSTWIAPSRVLLSILLGRGLPRNNPQRRSSTLGNPPQCYHFSRNNARKKVSHSWDGNNLPLQCHKSMNIDVSFVWCLV